MPICSNLRIRAWLPCEIDWSRSLPAQGGFSCHPNLCAVGFPIALYYVDALMPYDLNLSQSMTACDSDEEFLLHRT